MEETIKSQKIELIRIFVDKLPPKYQRLVKLRYFAGLTLEEAAAALDISRATASRYWAYARAFLYEAVSGEINSP